ncbi:death-inducer obliterator 1-like isoform X3 [Xyrauchen texanus]|uniref:death-inducer obliterator 1-like isoform X3 n=1 Tax=Xyrauchen texanus TaxID=154827 RepID=UPI0022422032|nr:death-inducer obliterator 1-like isoform X3 [Xyrauchen texanus]
MEESVSPELAQAPEPESSQDPVDTSSQESVLEVVKDQKDPDYVVEDKIEDPEKSKPSREFKKTWGFRRTTIAKREFPGEMVAESPEGKSAPVRRSGRQAKRTDKLEEFLVTVKRGRGTGRRSCPSRFEGGDPPSQTPTDAETASEASFDGNAEAKTEEQKVTSPGKRKRGRGRRAVKRKAGGDSDSDDGSSENEEEAGFEVTKESQEHVETGASVEDGKVEELKDEEQAIDVKKEDDGEEEMCKKSNEKSPNESISRRPSRAISKDNKRDTNPKAEAKICEEDDDDELSSSSSSSSESDSDGYDPNALYCICRQKHNKRFMICCDRCEEWFHGDCVGITEARGRLMERNGEDYVCPKCNTQKGQIPKTSASTAEAENGKRLVAGPRKSECSPDAGSTSATSSTAIAATEEKTADDLGIKGRIEKATNPSGKKKIKIFQPQVTAAEGSSLPKCIGPGCENDALPDTVYCGNDCILRHAAAAMKTITTDGKDSKQKERGKPKKNTNKSLHKRGSGPKRRSSNQADTKESKSETDEDDDDEDKHAEEQPPPPAMSSWSSDHNYIAVTPEKTTPISASVLNKASAQKDKEKEDIERVKPEKETASADKKAPASNVAPKGGKKSPGLKGIKGAAAISTPTKGKTSAAPLGSARDLRKRTPPQCNLGKSKKPGPPPPPIPVLSPSGPAGSRHHASGALRVAKSTFTIPKKQPQTVPKESAEAGPSPISRTPPSQMLSIPSIQHPVSKPTQPPPPAAPPQPPPNNQMRSNIRRSLTDILYKRVSDSDDLSMSENEVGKLAISIEKEMFSLYMNTDNKYKNKYRSLMFNLKDPKNKGLFYRVVGSEISPFRLVRLSPEELLSKEMSDWRKTENSEGLDISGRSQPGQPKTGSRQEGAPPDVDMEEAPPMSDGDDPQEDTRPTSATHTSISTGKGSAMPDIFSSMLKDTTAEHRAHLFDLNCKICTGQKSADDEPPSKKNKMSVSKKPEPPVKAKLEPRTSKAPGVEPSQVSSYSGVETAVPDTMSVMDDPSSVMTVVQAPVTAAVPAVSSVTITRRDPRTAGHRSSLPVSQAVPDISVPTMPASIPVSEPMVVETKGPLPMPPPAPASVPRPVMQKPASSQDVRHYGSNTASASEPRPEGETALFLSGQEMMWKGLINMHTVAKFVTKAYMVSGSFEHIKEDLPDTIHIGGRISPHTVWDYVGKLKTSLSKELCLIRFHPATEEEEVAYVSLFSYFSSRKRFGVVANSNKRIKDLYLIPLSSKDPLPAKLLPFDGPGLEPARPNLLLGLLICQKDKKRPGAPLENEEKRPKTLRDDETGLPKPSIVNKFEIKHEKGLQTSLDAISTTPPDTPPPLNSSESSSSVATSVFSILSSVKAPDITTSTGNNSPSSNVTAASAVSFTPLQTILKTLFGKKKQDSDVSLSPSDQNSVEVSVPSVSLLDPIVQKFAISKSKEVEVQDDRPYDPEEEYDPTVGYGTEKNPDATKVSAANKPAEVSSSVVDDIAYDPEDDSIFDDVRVEPGAKKLTEQQKVLEDNKQTEEPKRQLEGHKEPIIQQIPETLISQPVTSLLANSQLLQLGKKVEELVAKSSAAQIINQRRDPRQSRDPRQAAANRRQTSDSIEKEEQSPVTIDASLQQAAVIETPSSEACIDTQTTQLDITVDTPVEQPTTTDTPLSQVSATLDSQVQPDILQPESSNPEEESKSEVVPFLNTETTITESTEVSIPLLGDKIDPELVESYMENEPEEPKIEDDPIESESKSFEEVWPNSASILKADHGSSSGQPIKSTATTYYNISTISTSSSASIHSGMPQNIIHDNSSYMDSHSSHIQHITTTNPPNIPPPMSFPPPIGPPPILGPPPLQGPPPMTVPPPMHLPPPMSGPPPMPIPPMQGPPPTLIENDPSKYPPTGSYPPYQNQWGSGSQYDAPRGPPPPNFTPRGPPSFQPMGQRCPPPQIFDNSMNSVPPQHIRPRGPLPGPPPHGPPPPNFDGQRFNGPPPPFNFSGPRGPPLPFPGPPPNHFDNRAHPPSHFPGPRGPLPPLNIGDHGPPSNISRGPGDKYDDAGSSYHQGMDKPQIPSQGPPFRGPSPNHFDGRRGPPGPTGDMSGQRFPPAIQFRGSPQHRGSFEEPRGSSSQDFERHCGPSVQQFGGPRGPPPGHFDKDALGQPARYSYNDDNSSDVRPVRGPLLPTPPDGPIPVQGRVGGHSPDTHRDDHWRRHSPEMRRRSCSTRDGSEPHNRPSRFDGGSRDRDGPSRLSEERQRDLSEDRRRERDRESGRSWGWNREHEWDRGRERDRERDRSRERDRERGRSREREKEHSRERDRSRGRESERDGDKRRDRDGDGDKRRDRDGDGDKRRDRDGDGDKRRDRDGDGDKRRDRDGDGDKRRDRDGDGDKRRDRDGDGDKRRDRDGDGDKRRDRDGDEDKRRDRDGEGDKRRDRDGEGDKRRDRDGEGDKRRDRDGEGDKRRDRDGEGDKRRDRDGEGDKRRDRDGDRDRGREREQDRKDHDRDRAKNRDRERDRDRDSRDRRRERSRSRERERGKDRDRRDRDKDRGKEKDRRDRSRSKEKNNYKRERSDNWRAKSTESETAS